MIIQAEGFSSGKRGLEVFIDNQDVAEAEQLYTLMVKLKGIAFECQEHYQMKGGIVNVNRQYLNKAMSILRARDREVTAYGPGGEYNNRLVRQPSVCSVWPVIAYTNWRGFRPIWDVGSYRE